MCKYVSKVTRNYQITIPCEIREMLDIKEGEYVEFEIEGDKVIIRSIKRKWTKAKLGKKINIEEIEEIANSAFE